MCVCGPDTGCTDSTTTADAAVTIRLDHQGETDNTVIISMPPEAYLDKKEQK